MAIIAETDRLDNEYIWQSQQLRNRLYRMKQLERRRRINAARSAIDQRLRYAPEPHDIRTGDALNVVLDVLNDPMVSVPSLQGASKPIDVEAVKAIPLRYAAGGVTISLNELTRDDAPEAFRAGVIAPADGAFEAYARRLTASPHTTLGELVVFLHTFDLRFGEAETSEQSAVYKALYPQLSFLRGELSQELAVRGRGHEERRRMPGGEARGLLARTENQARE
jgi:hypothetical protein